MKMPDKLRVLELFRNSGGRVIKSWEVAEGQFYGTKPILGYTERISNARVIIGCTCGQNADMCDSIEHIRNIGVNEYQYLTKKLVYKPRPAQRTIPERTEKLTGEALTTWEALREKLGKKTYPRIEYT